MSSQNRLRLVTDKDRQLVTREAENFLPDISTIYGFLPFGFGHNSVDENRTKIYIPEKADSPFFIAVIGVAGTSLCSSLTIFWKIGTIPDEVVADYLASIPNVTWKKAVFFSACQFQILNELEKILIDDRLCSPANKRWKICDARLLKMDNATLDDIKLPNDLTLRPLKASDAKKIVANLHYFSETDENVAAMITNLPSSGIYYMPNESAVEELVSWILTKHNGEIGMTHTVPKFRGKKLATLVTNDLIRKHQILGHSPYVKILYDNHPAFVMHKKIGFTECCLVGHDMYQNPKNDSEEQERFKNF